MNAADLKVQETQERIIAWARSKGWCDREVSIPEQVALIHSEASEALEEWRNNKPLLYTTPDKNGNEKPEGIASEYADIVIRVFHYCSLLGIDLATELIRKMDYNDTRAHKHGGKAG
jgi:NTP pyrophosphatase (non-canonical NTP hydrolase)